ncbi:hypothetical protein D3C73_976580 [compost metagenome]
MRAPFESTHIPDSPPDTEIKKQQKHNNTQQRHRILGIRNRACSHQIESVPQLSRFLHFCAGAIVIADVDAFFGCKEKDIVDLFLLRIANHETSCFERRGNICGRPQCLAPRQCLPGADNDNV